MFTPSVVIASGGSLSPPGDHIMVAGAAVPTPIGDDGFIHPSSIIIGAEHQPLGTMTPATSSGALITVCANLVPEFPALPTFMLALQGNLADNDAAFRELVITGQFFGQPEPTTWTVTRASASIYSPGGAETSWQWLRTVPPDGDVFFTNGVEYGIFINDRSPP